MTVVAVEAEATIPMASVTPNPRTGPDPNQIRINAASRPVILVSKIVP